MNFLKISQLSFSYSKEKTPIHSFSIDAPQPGVYLLQGKSGSGKTTLALLMSGHLKPTEGKIFLNEKIVSGPSSRCFLVSQEDDLFPWMKIGDQIEFFRSFSSTGISTSEALKLVGISDVKDLYPFQLSGGMKKRVSLLRGTLLQPELLILDETLSAIEVELRADILNRLQPIWAASKTGVLVITHDPLPEIQFPLAGSWKV